MAGTVEYILVGGVIQSLLREGSWCGETHIQKASYVSKIIGHVPFESEFVLYKHGPFSFDLNATLNVMRNKGLLEITRQQIGSTYSLDLSLWNALNDAYDDMYSAYQKSVSKICHFFGRKNVAELERVTTAIYIIQNFPLLRRELRNDKLLELKPHIAGHLAPVAFSEAEALISAVV